MLKVILISEVIVCQQVKKNDIVLLNWSEVDEMMTEHFPHSIR
jgi:hypothetical protein